MDIRAERIAAGLSQSELAAKAGVAQPNLSAYENGRRAPSPEVLQRLARALAVRPSERVGNNREAIHAVVAQHHAIDPRLFGSVARGEDTPESDIDLLVTFTEDASLLDEVALRLTLTDLLGVDVDLVAEDTLKGELRERVLAEATAV